MRATMCWIAVVSVLALAGPVSARQTVGFQTIADFEEFATGTGDFYYDDNDTYVFGGLVTDGAGAGFAPHSGTNVYVGTGISTRQTNGDWDFHGVDLWPALGAWISPGAAAVYATFYGYDPDIDDVVVLGQLQTSGSDPNQYLSMLAPYGPAWLINVTFSSTELFAVDDIQFGLPDVGPGVPEPGVWAMLIAGFAGVGAVLRRRRASLQAA